MASYPAPTHGTLRAAWRRLLHPHCGWCLRCGNPWHIGCEPHTTYDSRTSGCFPLCEKCWGSLTPDQRLPYYDALLMSWPTSSRKEMVVIDGTYTMDRDQLVRRAVREGK